MTRLTLPHQNSLRALRKLQAEMIFLSLDAHFQTISLPRHLTALWTDKLDEHQLDSPATLLPKLVYQIGSYTFMHSRARRMAEFNAAGNTCF